MARCRLPVLAILLLTGLLLTPRPAHGQALYRSDYGRTLDLLAAPKVTPSYLPQIPAPGKKSVLLAAIYSLAVPGMGELYAGSFSSGKYFLGAEGVLWLTYAVFDIHATELQNAARAFASAHAGVVASGKSDQFYVDVGNFLTVADYNAKKMRDRSPELLYDPTAGYNWAWDSDLNRATFRDQRITSENVFNNRKFVVAAILVNHVASAINAARAAIARNKEAAGSLGDLRLEASVMGGWLRPHGILFTLSRPL